MLKKHKMLAEFVALNETEHGAIDLMASVKFMQDIAKLAKKHGFEAYAKGYPKEVLDYKPTGETIVIKTVEDIAKLTPEQFEMFVEDLRSWANFQRWLGILNDLGAEIKHEAGMIWIDSGEHKATIKATVEVSNKM